MQPMLTKSSDLVAMLASERHGITFRQCLRNCIANAIFIEQFNRLHHTNLQLKWHTLDRAIAAAPGQLEDNFGQFVDFCWHAVFLRFGNGNVVPFPPQLAEGYTVPSSEVTRHCCGPQT